MKTSSLKLLDDNNFDDIRVAAPCHAAWDDMVGSDSVRFCASCQKNVFNLSGMQRDEAIELLRATEGRACVRFYRRADGTVLTEDCPVGVRLLLRRAKKMTLAAAAVSAAAVAAVVAFLGGSFISKKLFPEPEHVMGSIAAMPPPAVDPVVEPVVMGQAIAPVVPDVVPPVVTPDVVMGEYTPPPPKPPKPRKPHPPVKTMGLVALPPSAK
jgi:hypothetical protein